MKVYVEEKDMPKSCAKCPCESDRWCNLMGYVIDEDEYADKRPTQCPLQSLSDHDKQVRKEVVSDIKEIIESDAVKYLDWDRDEFALDYQEFKDILNEIEQGENNG